MSGSIVVVSTCHRFTGKQQEEFEQPCQEDGAGPLRSRLLAQRLARTGLELLRRQCDNE
jgi:hypothetical protein